MKNRAPRLNADRIKRIKIAFEISAERRCDMIRRGFGNKLHTPVVQPKLTVHPSVVIAKIKHAQPPDVIMNQHNLTEW